MHAPLTVKILNLLPNFKFKFNSELESKFKADYIKGSLVFIRIALLLSLSIHILFVLFDNWAMPLSRDIVWLFRLVIIIPMHFFLMIFSFTKRFIKYGQIITIITVVIVGYAMMAIIGVSEPSEMGYSFYYIGIILYMMAVYTVLGLHFWSTVISGFFMSIGYLYVTLFMQKLLTYNIEDISTQVFINHNLFLFSTNLVGCFTSYNYEKLSRSNFLKKIQIDIERSETDQKNILLNQQNEELSTQKDMVEALNIEMSEQKLLIEDQKDVLQALNKELLLKHEEIQTQNEEILAQNAHLSEINDLIEQKNKHITDSIKYARRIQNAMFPPPDIYKKFFPDSFVFNKAKDIVSGDFYWFHGTSFIKNSQNFDKIYFALADCTGHGVPGAFMSMLCFNLLDAVIKENSFSDTDKLLNYLSKTIQNRLQQSSFGEIVNDGLDIALCCFDNTTLALQYSGIKHPLIIIRDNKLLEYKPKVEFLDIENSSKLIFLKEEVQLQHNDTLFLFTDGFADQFDKYGNHKYSMKRFRDLLLEIVDYSNEEKEKHLNYEFEKWKGNSEQTDDVMVLGIKIT